MDIDDYSRDRSRSPVRNRSRSPVDRNRDREGESYTSGGRRDYGSERSYRGRGRGNVYRGRGGRGGGFGTRGGNRGGYNSSYTSYATPEEAAIEYKSKTERNYDNSIFIGNIPYDAGPKDIEDMFKGQYKVRRADIVTNRGRSRGMATVEFSSKDEVKSAIEKFDHYEYRGRQIFVRQDYPPPEEKRVSMEQPGEKFSNRTPPSRERYTSSVKQSPLVPEPGTEIFVGNLPYSMNWQALKDLMREAGEVERADVRLDQKGKSMGYGTVVFKTPEEAKLALNTFADYEIEGRKLSTRPGRTHESTIQPKVDKNTKFTKDIIADGLKSDTIYVENLPYVTTVDDLYELFETIGKVTRAEIQYAPHGRASGNAVVRFESDELAELSIANLNSYNYGGRDLKISYANKPGSAYKMETKENETEEVDMEEGDNEVIDAPTAEEPEAIEVQDDQMAN
ncbi:g-strand binding protein [Yamadazyma tenuis]|nr:g-strand binding protein [Yamadazyma tenuis]